MNQFQLRDSVRLRGIPGEIIGINLSDKNDLFYIVRDEQRRSHHAYPGELTGQANAGFVA